MEQELGARYLPLLVTSLQEFRRMEQELLDRIDEKDQAMAALRGEPEC